MSDFVPNNRHLREVLIFLFHLKKTAAEAHRELQKVYGDAALSETTCRDWFRRFKDGQIDAAHEVIIKEEPEFIIAEHLECIIKKDDESCPDGKIDAAHEVIIKEETEFIIDEHVECIIKKDDGYSYQEGKIDAAHEVIIKEEPEFIIDEHLECIIKKDDESCPDGKIDAAHEVLIKEEHIDEDSNHDDVDDDISSQDENNIFVEHLADKVLVLIDEPNHQRSDQLQEECSQDHFKDSVSSEVFKSGTRGKKSCALEKKFMCDICGYKSMRKDRMTIHQRIHSGEKPFACHLCPFKTTEKVNLNRHLKVHSKEKLYQCPYCEYKGNNNGYLKTHLRIHANDKPYACQLCDYRTSIASHLSTHKKRHSTEKPFKCTHCDYEASVICDLNSHLKRHSLSKPFLCEFCPYRAYVRVVLNRHIKKHHHESIKNNSFNIVTTDTNTVGTLAATSDN